MDKEKIISELVSAPKYQERADVRTVVDETVAELREAKSKTEIKEVLNALKEKLASVLGVSGASNTESPRSETETPREIPAFTAVIDGLSLPNQTKEKLKEILNSYNESVVTAKELDPTVQIKPIEEVATAILMLGPAKFAEIAYFGQPTILVTPNNSFADKIVAMNRNKKYNNQTDTYVWKDANGPYKNIGTPSKTVISIVDAQPHMPHIPGVDPNSRFDQRKAAFKAHFAKKATRLINIHEAAVLQQLSLRNYQKNGNDVSKIVDYYQDENVTVSCLDDQYLTGSSFVAYACFDADVPGVLFLASNPGFTVGYLRGRPSVQVLEYWNISL